MYFIQLLFNKEVPIKIKSLLFKEDLGMLGSTKHQTQIEKLYNKHSWQQKKYSNKNNWRVNQNEKQATWNGYMLWNWPQ